PRGGFSPCIRVLSMRYAGVSKFMVRLYVLSTNLGHGELGFTFCPIAKSNPEPEYSTDFSDPIAFDALSITDFASCASTVQLKSTPAANAAMHLLLIFAS